MKHKLKWVGVILASVLLTGCSKVHTNLDNSTSDKVENSHNQAGLFDKLSETTRVILSASILEPQLQDDLKTNTTKLKYSYEGNDLFIALDNGIGNQQSMDYLTVKDDSVTPLQSILYNLDTKKADKVNSINSQSITKDMLYQRYLQNKEQFDKLSSNVEKNRNVYLDFLAGLRNSGSPMALTNEEYKSNLNNKELSLAAYAQNYIKDRSDDINVNIVSTLNHMLSDSFLFRFTEADDGYNLDGIQQTYRQNFKFSGNQIICTLSPSDAYTFVQNGTSTISVDIDEIQTSFQSYKGLLKLLTYSVPASEEYSYRLRETAMPSQSQSSSTTSFNSDVNTRNLTTQQAVDWVKNYMLQDGATQGAVDDTGFECRMDTDGYVKIYVYMWVPTHAYRRLDYTYRIDGNGYLQREYGMGTDKWDTVSTRYIQ